MKHFTTPMMAMLVTLIGLLMPILMIPLVFLIRWDDKPTYVRKFDDAFDQSFVRRGDLPWWLSWVATIDSRYPGGLYEPTMSRAVGSGGYLRRLWASYIWTGHRNRLHGMAAYFGCRAECDMKDPYDLNNWVDGKPALLPDWEQSGNTWRYERGDVWQNMRKITGHQTYRLNDGTFWAIPVCNVKRKTYSR
jgi:hypothetical protein